MFCSRCGQQVDASVKYCPNCGLDVTAVTQGGAAGTATQPAADDSATVREALKDEYELEKELGRGGMAIVYKARDKSLDREVAIKVLPFSLSFDAEFVERFQREARTSAKLEHPNIIPIYRVGKSGRVIYFVMKFLRGKPLSDVIKARGALPVPETTRVLIEAGRALGYAHKHGIVHRDIKPDNIMFDELGQAILTDFGIAKAQSGAKLTGTGMTIGTPYYMSPEQARAQPLDGRSDLYSLGVVGYQCLTGHVPFDGEDSFSIGYKHIMEELPTPPLESAEQRELFAIIQRMMAKKQDDRYQNAEDLVTALAGSGGVASALNADVATRPTETVKGLTGGVASMASQATTPLPRASASLSRPPAAAAPTAAMGAAAAKPQPPRALRPTPKPKSQAPLYAGAVLVVVIAALAGYYLLVPHRGGAAAGAAADATRRTLAVATPDTAKPAAARAESTPAPAAAPAPPAPVQPRPQSQPASRRERLASKREREAPAGKQPPRRVVAGPNCEDANVSKANPGGACWDTRPKPISRLEVSVPASCGSARPGMLRVNVLVSPTGDVQRAFAIDRSACATFPSVAVAQAADFRFQPALLHERPVSAWIQIVIRPVR